MALATDETAIAVDRCPIGVGGVKLEIIGPPVALCGRADALTCQPAAINRQNHAMDVIRCR